jgi:hypothetical protein
MFNAWPQKELPKGCYNTNEQDTETLQDLNDLETEQVVTATRKLMMMQMLPLSRSSLVGKAEETRISRQVLLVWTNYAYGDLRPK